MCDDCEGDDERATRYYLHKQLKNFCLPGDVLNIKRWQLIFETFDSLDRVWFSRGRRGKSKSGVETFTSDWHVRYRQVFDIVKTFYDALYEFDYDDVIESLYAVLIA